MRHRALVHSAGPKGAGKTTLIERLLEARVAFAACVRAVRDRKAREPQESAPEDHDELGRYRRSGARTVALYRFRDPDLEAFYSTAFMERYSEAVLIEGNQARSTCTNRWWTQPRSPSAGGRVSRDA